MKTAAVEMSAPECGAADLQEPFRFAQVLIESRHNVSPKRLSGPGPSPDQLEALFQLAAAAPDHGQLTPWRFVVVPPDRRHRLAEAFALALTDRDPDATQEQVETAREKAHRAPFLMVAIARLGRREPDTPPMERMLSMGAAIQNFVLGACAMGFGTGITGGQAMSSQRLAALLDLADGEVAVCCVSIGSAGSRKSPTRVRPRPAAFVLELGD